MTKKLTQDEIDELLNRFQKMLDDGDMDADGLDDFASIHGLDLSVDLDEGDVEQIELEFNINKDAELPPPIPQCEHKNKRVNVISMSLKFWYCPDCKADLGDYND